MPQNRKYITYSIVDTGKLSLVHRPLAQKSEIQTWFLRCDWTNNVQTCSLFIAVLHITDDGEVLQQYL